MYQDIREMKREIIITFLCAFLLGALIALTMFGCKCNWKKTNETFTGDAEPEKFDGTLSPAEEELFKDIQTGQLNDQDIMKMVENGKITEKMVEKFLAYLDSMPDPDAGAASTKKPEVAVPASSSKRAPALPKQDEGFEVEAFTGGMYAFAPAK